MTLDMNRRHRPIAGESGHPDAKPEIYIMIAMQSGESRADLLTADLQQGLGSGFDHGHIGSVLPGGRSRLAADPAAADDHYPSALGKPLSERKRFFEGPQCQKSVKISTGQIQPSRTRARGNQQLVVWILSTASDDDLATPIDPGSRGS